MDDEAFWSNDPKVLQDSEWTKISSEFTNAGYREGITAGKESALQAGFDEGFAQVGAPLGRELGILRGLCSALVSFLTRSPSSTPQSEAVLAEVREIAAQLANVRFSDIAPPDLEALAHAREHLENARTEEQVEDAEALRDPARMNEEIRERRDVEGLEDLMAQMNAGGAGGGSAAAVQARPRAEDVARLKERLLAIVQGLGLSLQWS
ncbi:hypothetical protein OH77DRAFT_200893 [Trametes cingulata]|nr:hypothetical protein OH77DRAFT_200893 [Trametes cingulata]